MDVTALMQAIPFFYLLKSDFIKEPLLKKMKTLCFDIENVFIRKVDLLDIEEVNTLSNA